MAELAETERRAGVYAASAAMAEQPTANTDGGRIDSKAETSSHYRR